MPRPLLRASSKGVATGPLAGQIHTRSSSPASRGAAGGAAGATDTGDTADGALATTIGDEAVPVGAEAPLGASSGRDSTREGATLRADATVGSALGGATRTTWPTSMTLGLSMLFQRAMSRQFCPVSRPMRISVSPGFTV